MTAVTFSAPGKLVVLGEHAVVYGHPCLVMSVGQRLKATVELTAELFFSLEAPDVGISGYRKPMDALTRDMPKGASAVEFAVNRLKTEGMISAGVSVRTTSQFSASYGFGSSGVSAACVTAAVLHIVEGAAAPQRVFNVAYQSTRDAGSTGSGVDIASAIFGGLTYFVTGGRVIERLSIPALSFLIGYTGVKVDTGSVVAEVKERFRNRSELLERIFTDITSLVEDGRTAAEAGDLRAFGKLMDDNEGFLEELGVGSPKLSVMISAARGEGALGAKLSGSGKGDCMIALVEEEKRAAVAIAIEKSGGQVIDVPCCTEGLKME